MLVKAIDNATIITTEWPKSVKKWEIVRVSMPLYAQYMSNTKTIECLSHRCTDKGVEYLGELKKDMNVYTMYGLVNGKKWDIVSLGKLWLKYYLDLWYMVWWDKNKIKWTTKDVVVAEEVANTKIVEETTKKITQKTKKTSSKTKKNARK